MSKTYKPYTLVRSLTGEEILHAANVRYLLPRPYALAFEEYPAATTRIFVMRKVSSDCEDYGMRTLELRREGQPGANGLIDYYVTIGEAKTEKEAITMVDNEMAGGAAMEAVLKKHGYRN